MDKLTIAAGIGQEVQGFDWGKKQEDSDRYKVLLDSVIISGMAPGLLAFATEGAEIIERKNASRIQARAIIEDYLLKIPDWQSLLPIEAKIPIDDHLTFAYLGGQTDERTLSPGIIQGLDNLMDIWGVKNEELGSYWNNPSPLPEDVMAPEIIDSLTLADLTDLGNVLSASFRKYLFDPSKPDDIKEIYGGSQTKLFVIRDIDRHIVSMTAVDLSKINAGKKQITLAELTDFATAPEWRRKGLSNILRATAIEHALYEEKADVVFVESNALSGGANKGNVSMGMPFVGRLPCYSCILSSDPGTENADDKSLRVEFPPEFRDMAPLNIYGASARSLSKFIRPLKADSV